MNAIKSLSKIVKNYIEIVKNELYMRYSYMKFGWLEMGWDSEVVQQF